MSEISYFVDKDGYDNTVLFAVVDGDKDHPATAMVRDGGITARDREVNRDLFEKMAALVTADQAMSHDDLVLLVDWMARTGESPENIAEVVRKPWNYRDELAEAKEAQDLADRVVSARLR